MTLRFLAQKTVRIEQSRIGIGRNERGANWMMSVCDVCLWVWVCVGVCVCVVCLHLCVTVSSHLDLHETLLSLALKVPWPTKLPSPGETMRVGQPS
jgi:hypothetical protein